MVDTVKCRWTLVFSGRHFALTTVNTVQILTEINKFGAEDKTLKLDNENIIGIDLRKDWEIW